MTTCWQDNDQCHDNMLSRQQLLSQKTILPVAYVVTALVTTAECCSYLEVYCFAAKRKTSYTVVKVCLKKKFYEVRISSMRLSLITEYLRRRATYVIQITFQFVNFILQHLLSFLKTRISCIMTKLLQLLNEGPATGLLVGK